MAKPHFTEQERIDNATLRMDDPSRIVGSGYIQFPPQKPFSHPITHQPPTMTGQPASRNPPRGMEGRPQRQRVYGPPPAAQAQNTGSYSREQPRQRPQQEPQHRSHAGSYKQASRPPTHGEAGSQQASQGARPRQQNGQQQAQYPRGRNPPRSQPQNASTAIPASQTVNRAAPNANGHLHQPQASRPVSTTAQTADPPEQLDKALDNMSLQEKAAHEEPLSKAQAKRLRKKLREGRVEA